MQCISPYALVDVLRDVHSECNPFATSEYTYERWLKLIGLESEALFDPQPLLRVLHRLTLVLLVG
jgi:hypothetical protein